MNQARHSIFNNIRNSLKRKELDANISQSLEARLTAHTVHEQPVVGPDLVTKFFYQLEKVVGTHESISTLTDLPFAILEFLQKHQLPKEMVIDAGLNQIPWPHKFSIAYRAAQAHDVTSVSLAFAGVAETGSLVLLSSPTSPTTLNFLPENHIIVLLKDNLVAHIEEVWTRLRTRPMPRTVNFITGPSRTADIEQTIQLGAHGPRRLHVILVKK
jgi:L-lactate dehydrogenase complex protein LldG